VALLVPEPAAGGLPGLNSAEPVDPVEPADPVEPLDGPGDTDEPGTGVTVLAWLAAPGSRIEITPATAIPATAAAAVRDRTMERPRSLAATALANLSRFMAASSAGSH
jgi:hypothetical protein